MKPEENQIINELNFCMIVLNWNRAQENPPIEITKEYFVAQELLKLFSQGKQYPESKFDEPRVQIVYEILCADEAPPKGEHWEGFIARRIVDALAKPEQEPVQFLLNGARYKVALQHHFGNSIVGLPEHLNGQWVALVDATDGKHLNYTAPPRKPRVSLPDEELMDAYCETPPFCTYAEAFIAGVRFIEANSRS